MSMFPIALSIHQRKLNAMSLEQESTLHHTTTGGVFYLTFWTYQRIPMLTSDKWRGFLTKSVEAACREHRFQLLAFVFMPDQVQLIVEPLDDESDIDRFLESVKYPVTEQVRLALRKQLSPLTEKLTVVESPRRRRFHFWEEGPAEQRQLTQDIEVTTAIEEIHSTPVHRRLCENASQWKWSSAGSYETNGQTVDADLPQLHRFRTD